MKIVERIPKCSPKQVAKDLYAYLKTATPSQELPVRLEIELKRRKGDRAATTDFLGALREAIDAQSDRGLLRRASSSLRALIDVFENVLSLPGPQAHQCMTTTLLATKVFLDKSSPHKSAPALEGATIGETTVFWKKKRVHMVVQNEQFAGKGTFKVYHTGLQVMAGTDSSTSLAIGTLLDTNDEEKLTALKKEIEFGERLVGMPGLDPQKTLVQYTDLTTLEPPSPKGEGFLLQRSPYGAAPQALSTVVPTARKFSAAL